MRVVLVLAALLAAGCAGRTLVPWEVADPAPAPRPSGSAGARGPDLSTAAPPADVPAEDRRMFEEANAVRRSLGLRPFRWHPRLHRAAREHSEEQARHGYMGHGSPDPARDDLADRLRLAGYGPASSWAEIVAKGYDGPKSVTVGWMNSRGHRKILTDPALEEAGFARVGDAFTGNFGTPMR